MIISQIFYENSIKLNNYMLEDPIARLFGALYEMEQQGLISFLERGIVKDLIIQGSERVT